MTWPSSTGRRDGGAAAVPEPAGAVSGLRGVAAGVAGRRRAGRAGRVLAEHAGGREVLEFPTDRPRGDTQTNACGHADCTVGQQGWIRRGNWPGKKA